MPVEEARNFGGLFGAYFSDVGYCLFGLSSWWWIAAPCAFLYKNFCPLQKRGNYKPYNHRIAGTALLLLLLCSLTLESLPSNDTLNGCLSVGAGGLVGAVADTSLSWLLGKSGNLLTIAAILLLAVSLLT